jgi:hypothetical protein
MRIAPRPTVVLLSIALSLTCSAVLPAHARVWVVLADGSGDAPTIQAAVDSAAAEGDTILVGPGTYSENVWIEEQSLLLVSMAGRDSTSVVSPSTEPAITALCDWQLYPRIVGFTFTATGGNGAKSGGSGGIAPTFEACAFTHSSYGLIGRAYEDAGDFIDCLFADNTYDGLSVDAGEITGGEIRDNGRYGVRVGYWSITVRECSITANGEHGIYGDGGAEMSGTSIHIHDCLIADNDGYGLYGTIPFYWHSNIFVITGSTISGNGEGGMYGFYSSFELEDCVVRDNDGRVAYGDALGVEMTRCVVFGNQGGIRGNSTDFWGVAISSVWIIESTFHDNVSGIVVTPLWEFAAAYLRTERSIISGCTSGRGVPYCGDEWTHITIECTDLFDNAGGNDICPSIDLGGNFSADPLFCDAAAGDFTLAADSPCAPEQSPTGCDLIGARPVGCAAAGVAPGSVPPVTPFARVVPNPVRTFGTIEWSSAAAGETTLRLFDARGRLVLRRAMNARGAGLQRARWEEVTGGTRLPSGVYYLEVDAAGLRSTSAVPVVVVR